ncbi:hypothetical protein [Thermoflavifilum thermophilum]|uniref:Uncharacterized protein n=1 Tax=Thermoflavifilum thermophilum TaxID=1393122 RepID=A0A1I7N0A3_9BACT|nr:hypothetical protein [Thermoflavifilum thermophilum]SFV28107.1 hypothetical protein SAMN05660895_0258 [Thermoflavifilum thermophilum]
MHEEHGISIWFFIGSLLTIYGLIIVIASLPALFSAINQPHVVLADLHAGLWWGAILLLLGIFYVITYWPAKKDQPHSES